MSQRSRIMSPFGLVAPRLSKALPQPISPGAVLVMRPIAGRFLFVDHQQEISFDALTTGNVHATILCVLEDHFICTSGRDCYCEPKI